MTMPLIIKLALTGFVVGGLGTVFLSEFAKSKNSLNIAVNILSTVFVISTVILMGGVLFEVWSR